MKHKRNPIRIRRYKLLLHMDEIEKLSLKRVRQLTKEVDDMIDNLQTRFTSDSPHWEYIRDLREKSEESKDWAKAIIFKLLVKN